MTSRIRFLPLFAAAAVFGAAAVRELAVWRADQLAAARTPESLRAALELTPGDAAKWRRLGIALAKQSPPEADAAFRNAAAANPFDTDSILGQAAYAESTGRSDTAEALYSQAARLSRRFRPQYALASFYARAGRLPEFWRTAARAAAIDRADITPVIKLAASTGAPPDDLASLLNLHTDHALASYLHIAMAENRPVPIAQTALRLPPTPERRDLLLAACDHLIAARRTADAVAIWNRLAPSGKLDPAAGHSLTNGAFTHSDIRAFNWRLHPVHGADFRYTSSGLRVELSGEQPEHVELLGQFAPVLPQRRYRLTVRSAADDLPGTPGLGWRVQCDSNTLASAVVTGPLSFATPAGCDLVRITLIYTRQPGTVRIAGIVDLLSATLELLP